MLSQYNKFLVHHNWLTKFSADNLHVRYQFASKHHHMWHIVYNARFLNPKMLWCYEFEDFVGLMIRSAQNSMARTPLHIVGRKVLENWLLLLQLRLRH